MIISAASDYRAAAQRILPPFLFHYMDGGAYSEYTLRRNVEDLSEVALRQRILKNMSDLSLETTLFNEKLSMPVALGPVGLCGMYARRGEVQAAVAAGRGRQSRPGVRSRSRVQGRIFARPRRQEAERACRNLRGRIFDRAQRGVYKDVYTRRGGGRSHRHRGKTVQGRHDRRIKEVIIMDDCIFCRIIGGKLPSYKIYEDDKTYAFLDIAGDFEGHTLVVPKAHCTDLRDCGAEDLAAVTAAYRKYLDQGMPEQNRDPADE